jgi:hypothetical protein
VGSESHTADILPHRCASGSCRSTPGVLGSEASSVVPLHHGVLRPHPSVSRARDDFAALPFIRRAFAVRERLGDPRDLPYFHRCAVHACHRPYAGGSVTPSRCSCAPQYQASPISKRVATHKTVSASYTRREERFDAASFALCYGPHVCLALLTGYRTGGITCVPHIPSEDFVTPAFGACRRRPTLGIRLDGRTGNLPSSGLAPDQLQQLVRLHLKRTLWAADHQVNPSNTNSSSTARCASSIA